jgi:hypothetical protein
VGGDHALQRLLVLGDLLEATDEVADDDESAILLTGKLLRAWVLGAGLVGVEHTDAVGDHQVEVVGRTHLHEIEQDVHAREARVPEVLKEVGLLADQLGRIELPQLGVGVVVAEEREHDLRTHHHMVRPIEDCHNRQERERERDRS